MNPRLPEFVIRVRLPHSAAYSPGPSGDTAFDDACKKAIEEAMPPGFVAKKLRLNERVPEIDGLSYVPIVPVDENNPLADLAKYVDRIRVLESRITLAYDALRSVFAKPWDKS